jgi:NAD(P)-dependent dehydrogenase (short-subunit alcohol dehydrogenase family)
MTGGFRLDGVADKATPFGGIIARGDLLETGIDEWRRVLEVDLSSIFYSTRAALPLLRAAGGGSIVNFASLSGTRSIVNVAYEAAKGGVISLTRRLADELAKDHIRVNTVSPGFTATPLNQKLRDAGAERKWVDRIPLGRYGQPAEIAAACAFLASDDASYITGFDLVVDGGVSSVLRPLPNLANR